MCAPAKARPSPKLPPSCRNPPKCNPPPHPLPSAMLLEIVKYGHPALRQKGARLEKITPEIKKLIADMLETMYANKGVGLAAQQVGRPLQLTVLDVRGATDRPSTIEVDGK